jgi:hypothetical protein
LISEALVLIDLLKVIICLFGMRIYFSDDVLAGIGIYEH